MEDWEFVERFQKSVFHRLEQSPKEINLTVIEILDNKKSYSRLVGFLLREDNTNRTIVLDMETADHFNFIAEFRDEEDVAVKLKSCVPREEFKKNSEVFLESIIYFLEKGVS
jgi:hypothetical protein